MGNGLPHWTLRLSIYLAIIGFSVALMMSESEADSGIYARDSFWPPIRLVSASVKWRSFVSAGRDPLIFPYEHKDATELEVDTDVLRFLYFDSRVYGVTDNSQYRAIGLNLHVGARLFDWLRFEYEHTSEHTLDGTHAYLPKFPVYDSVGIVLDLYRSKQPRESLGGD